MIGASTSMRKWALKWRRENNRTMREALGVLGRTYFMHLDGVAIAYTQEPYQGTHDIARAFAEQINAQPALASAVTAEVKDSTITVRSSVHNGFTIDLSAEEIAELCEPDEEERQQTREEYYQARHDLRHAVWNESQPRTYDEYGGGDYDMREDSRTARLERELADLRARIAVLEDR